MAGLPARKKPVASPPAETPAPKDIKSGLPPRKKAGLPQRTKPQPANQNPVTKKGTQKQTGQPDTKVPSTEIEVLDTIPWPDWKTPERNAVRSLELAGYASRAPYRPWWERHDLWWSDELFGNGNPTWRTPGSYIWTTTQSVTGTAARRRVRVPEFTGNPSGRSPHSRQVISALLMWHHATSRQLAALCGHHPTNFSGRILKPLYDAGLIERGRFSTTTESTMKHDYCYRIRVDEPLWRWLDKFDDETWNNITYGVVPAEPRNHVRHNLMAFEIALRTMEAVPNITAVYGERVTSMKKLLGTNNKQHGDIGLVRKDGLRIVVELIHEQYRDGFSNKIASWGRALTAKGTVREHGTVVVFVVAPKAFNDSIGEIRKRFKEALTPQGLTDPVSGVAADPNKVANARLHVFLAAWPDWFPGPHSLSTEFLNMTAWRLNVNDQWASVDLADPATQNGYPFTPQDPLAWSYPARLYGQLYGQPTWLHDQKTNTKQEEFMYIMPDFPKKQKSKKV
jgi:hypothetical protein